MRCAKCKRTRDVMHVKHNQMYKEEDYHYCKRCIKKQEGRFKACKCCNEWCEVTAMIKEGSDYYCYECYLEEISK